jgi:hypothetical protein
VSDELGPFDSPYQPAATTAAAQSQWERTIAGWAAMSVTAARFPALQSIVTNESSAQSSGGILATGREFLPVGGFSGQVPATPLPVFISDVRGGRVAFVLAQVAPLSRNPDIRWTMAHCGARTGKGGTVRSDTGLSRLYLCTPSDAAG